MRNATEEFNNRIEQLKTLEFRESQEIYAEVYEYAEEVMLQNGAGGYEKEFNILKEIIKTTEPVVLDPKNNITETYAWSEMMKRALEAQVIEDLTEEQRSTLLELVGTYDDGVDVWVCENLDNLNNQQIAQIYLSQTIGFYYYFGSLPQFEPALLSDVVFYLYNV